MNRLHAEPLRQIAAQIGLLPLREVVTAPGVNEALRLTIAYAQAPRRPPDQVATLKAGHAGVWLEISYLTPDAPDAPDAPRHGRAPFPEDRYRELRRLVLQAGFDRLDDQPAGKLAGDLWLLERAAAHYHRDLVLIPGSASGAHLAIIERIRRLWPEALQESGQPGIGEQRRSAD